MTRGAPISGATRKAFISKSQREPIHVPSMGGSRLPPLSTERGRIQVLCRGGIRLQLAAQQFAAFLGQATQTFSMFCCNFLFSLSSIPYISSDLYILQFSRLLYPTLFPRSIPYSCLAFYTLDFSRFLYHTLFPPFIPYSFPAFST